MLAGVTVLGGVDGCRKAVATYAANNPTHETLVADLLQVSRVVAVLRTWVQRLGKGRWLVAGAAGLTALPAFQQLGPWPPCG